METRPAWRETWLGICRIFAARSTCPRAAVGAVLVRDNRLIAAGYNGAPRGQPHCTEVGCRVEHGGCTRAVHAEMNAVLHAKGDTFGCTLYTTLSPCPLCLVILTQAGIKSIVYERRYHGAPPISPCMEIYPAIPEGEEGNG